MTRWLPQLRKLSLAGKAALLLAGTLAWAGLVGPLAWAIGGATGTAAAAVAGALCLAGALAALLVSPLLARREQFVLGVLLAMAARMGIPLGAALALHLTGGTLAKAGLLYYVLVFYPVTLTLETLCTLPPSQPAEAAASDREEA